jgi:hypothetical protein
MWKDNWTSVVDILILARIHKSKLHLVIHRTCVDMEGPPRYAPLSLQDMDDLEEKTGTAWNAKSTEIIPTNTRSFVIGLSILLLSLSANILLVMDNARLRIALRGLATEFSGLAFDIPTPYHAVTKYWHPNSSESDMDAAWDAIDTGPST